MIATRVTRNLAIVLLLLAACGGDSAGPGGLGMGTSTATVTGTVSGSYTGGIAIFGVGSIPGVSGDGFVIVLEDDAGDIVIGVVMDRSTRPGTGTYQITADGANTADIDIDGRFFDATSGTLTITSSSAQSLAGTLTFQASEVLGSGTVSVNASFNAMCFAGGFITSCD